MTTEATPIRSQIYQALEDARRDLLAAIEGIPDEKMTVPAIGEWSVKDLLAHITSWEEQVPLDLRRVRQGLQPALASFREADVDQWNALLVGLRRTFPLSQVRQELGDRRKALVEALDSLPDSAFAAGFVPATCAICIGHDRQHAADIRAWRQQQGV
ncbi:MAG TPA: DinB family protein [Dehalococcoidia bacterium]|nr:DinB family protein [Dehalococcoidia bacterium]